MITINDHSSLEYIFYHRRFRIKGRTTYRALGIAPFRSLEEFSLRWWFKICHLVLQLLVFFSNFRNFVQKFSHKIIIWSSSWSSWSSILISWFSAFCDVDAIILAWLQRGRQCPFTNNGQISLLSSTTTLLVTLVSRCFTWQQSLVSPQYHAQCSIFTRLHMLSQRIKFFLLGSLVGYRCTFGVSSTCVCLFAS